VRDIFGVDDAGRWGAVLLALVAAAGFIAALVGGTGRIRSTPSAEIHAKAGAGHRQGPVDASALRGRRR
jgi:hypothetical protein